MCLTRGIYSGYLILFAVAELGLFLVKCLENQLVGERQFNEASLWTRRKLVSLIWLRGQGSTCRLLWTGCDAGQGVANCINYHIRGDSIWVMVAGLYSLVLGKIPAPSLQLLCMCGVFDRQQEKFLIICFGIVLSNIEPLSVGFYWNIIISRKVVPLVWTKGACVVRFGLSMCSRTWPALTFGLDYVFLFCFHALNSVFEFTSYLKYFIEFETRSYNISRVACLRSHCNAYHYCLLAYNGISITAIGSWWINSR